MDTFLIPDIITIVDNMVLEGGGGGTGNIFSDAVWSLSLKGQKISLELFHREFLVPKQCSEFLLVSLFTSKKELLVGMGKVEEHSLTAIAQ